MAQTKERHWAWLVPWIGAAMASGASTRISDAVGPARAVCLFFGFGLLLGWAWARLYPRPLIDRVVGFAVWACVLLGLAFVISFVPGGELTISDDAVGAASWAGIFAALVLVESKRVQERRS